MAKKQIEYFVSEVQSRPELQEKMKDFHKECVEKNLNMEEAVSEMILPIAKEMGISFSVDEYMEYVKNQAENRMLDDEELDVAVGGMRDVYVEKSDRDVIVVDNSQYYNYIFVFPSANKQ